MHEAWNDFFLENKVVLSEGYPGITLHRFLKDVEDILKHQTHQLLLNLSQSIFQVPPIVQMNLNKSLSDGVPLASLMGFSEFYGHKFYVNKDVLIPRPETELMVDYLVKKYAQEKIVDILDVGTGSGVILLSLISNDVGEKGVGTDLSDKALNVAKTNSRRLRLHDQVKFLECDRLEKVSGSFDLILSNPPYIKPKSHKSLVQTSVDAHEPSMALYIEDDQYEQWFNQLFTDVLHKLKPGGFFMMEGHELELRAQLKQLNDLGYCFAEVLQDYAGLDRFLVGKKKL